MTKKEVFNLLEKNKNDRGIAAWERLGVAGMRSFGLGMTQLKKLAKQVGKNHELALELWETDVYDAKILATIIDDPKLVAREQVARQIKDLNHWMFNHAYCNYLLGKVPFLQSFVEEWTQSGNAIERHCGYLCLYQLSKNDKKLPDEFFLPYIDTFEADLQTEENFVKDGMDTALLMVGQRSKVLHARALAAARKIGKMVVDYGDNSCEALDVVKHLTSERILKKIVWTYCCRISFTFEKN